MNQPWRCRCGAWLHAKPLSFNWVDLVVIIVLFAIELFIASRFWWALNPLFFFTPIGAWLAYRMSRQFTVEEIPAPEEESREIA